MKHGIVAIAVCLLAGVSQQAWSAGFALNENSAIESGEADAGRAAAADDASTLTTNPAGMTYFNDLVTSSASLHYIIPNGQFSLGNATTHVGVLPIPESGGSGPDQTASAVIPSAYLIVAPT